MFNMLEEIIEFSKVIGKLKKVKRTGWIERVGANNTESVAEHTFRSAVLAMIVGDSRGLDTEKMVRMVLLHDLHEIVIGDIPTPEKKNMVGLKEKEIEAMRTVLSSLPKNLSGKYFELWEDFEEQRSEEAKIAKQVDVLDFFMHALEYEKDGHDKKKFDIFWENERKSITDVELKKIFDALEKERS